MRHLSKFGCAVALVLMHTLAIASSSAATKEWRFDVLLDGKPIGLHRFQLDEAGSHQELLSEASFNVKALFVSVYRYAHESREAWRDGCLYRIAARTDARGERTVIKGTQIDDRFQLTADSKRDLDGCIKTFAYWNPGILEATHLLNPQTGEYVPVRITHIGRERIHARGADRDADRFRIQGDAKIGGRLVIDVWYSADESNDALTDKHWLGLQSTTVDGRTLRYQLQ